MPGFSMAGCELGVASAATQIEGGQLDTNWHRWAASGGAVDGSSPARAADHWNRVSEDTSLLAEMGIGHYRLGIEWVRVEPSPGEFDPAAIGHYREELSGLRAAGVRPLVTLHHFNLPGWLADAGGWLAPEATEAFLRFVRRMVTDLGDIVDEWIPINEPNVYAVNSYLFGLWPPDEHSYRRTIRVLEILATAHIAAYELIHRLQPEAKVGTATHLRVFAPANPLNPWHQLAAHINDHLFQRAPLRAMSTGRFPAPLRRPSWVRPGRYYDFQGINYYTRSTVSGLANGVASNVPVNDLGWEVFPSGLGEVAAWVHTAYPAPIYVTENGTADAADAFRSRYLYDHLAVVAASGLPIQRYYHWCFTDNWEWAEGESARFGLVALDFESQQRMIRASGRFYADVIANRGVTAAAYQRWVAGQEYPTNG